MSATQELQSRAETTPLQRLSILVVESDESTAPAISTIFSRMKGIDAVMAANGVQALEALQQAADEGYAFDLVMTTDRRLEGEGNIHGLDVALAAARASPVVVLTTDIQTVQLHPKITSLPPGALVGFLLKPVSSEVLQELTTDIRATHLHQVHLPISH